jgi:hypothetical protein
MPQQDNSVTLENVRIIFRNFAGRENPYNQAGSRNFGVLLTPEIADSLSRDGWNVKVTKERELDEGELTGGEPWLPVAVGYKGRPPTVVMIGSRGRTNLDESTIELLDYADIQNVDLIVRPYDWELATGKSGRKAYLKSIYVTVNEDELEQKYADVPHVGTHQRPIED